MRAERQLEIQKAKKAQRVNKARASPVAAAPADNRTESEEPDLEEVMVQMLASIDEKGIKSWILWEHFQMMTMRLSLEVLMMMKCFELEHFVVNLIGVVHIDLKIFMLYVLNYS
jgi:hypothetical protein